MTQLPFMLEQALQHHGDTLYRLALLLSPDTAAAEAALLRMARQLTIFPDDQSAEDVLLRALQAALPPEQRATRRLPAWATAEAHSPDTALLAGIARLPRDQRLALAMSVLHVHEEQEPALEQRIAFRDALLALAPAADYPNLAQQMLDKEAPEQCQAARAALALDDPALHHNPAVRGHLALCDQCRAVSQAWQQVADRSEDSLRAILRRMHMPETLAQRMVAATLPKQFTPLRTLLASPWTVRALLPLVVILAIAALVWPRSDPNPSPVPRTGAPPADLRTLVLNAQTSLYDTPATGVWHSRYALRWTFADGSYAPLVGDLWTDSQTGRTRVQLTHESGGGPYEFMLADGTASLWYATTNTYGESVYPLFFDPRRARVQLNLDRASQKQAIDNRLQSGAWALPATYLRQAAGAELQSWGRQVDSAGVQLEVIGFNGVSALTSQANVPGGPSDRITILLLISRADGRLREVRELIGPTGGDQISRTIWSALGAEQLDDEQQINRAFSLKAAWNGTGLFPSTAQRDGPPLLPLLDPDTFISPAFAIEYPRLLFAEFPAVTPPDAKYAAFMSLNSDDAQALVYVGGGRSLTVLGQRDSVANQATFSTDGVIEQATLAGRPALVRRTSADGYAVLLRPAPNTRRRSLLQVQARGYTHDELFAVLNTLGPLTVERYQAQSGLFAAVEIDTNAQAALVKTLAVNPKLGLGQAHYVVARVYTRQNSATDDLTDPYHLPPYGGRPPELISERWTFDAPAAQSGAITPTESLETFTRLSNASGQIYETSYSGPTDDWRYRSAEQLVEHFTPGNQMRRNDLAHSMALRFLTCGGYLADTPAGQAIAYTERDWYNQPCMLWDYRTSVQLQRLPRWSSDLQFQADDVPYLADLYNEPKMTTFIRLGDDGQIHTIETRMGTAPDGTLIESWQLERDEIISVAQLPHELSKTPPVALFDIPADRLLVQSPLFFQPATITESLKLINSPLLTPPTTATASWFASRLSQHGGPPFASAPTPFDEALWRGIAVQLEVQINNRTTSRREALYIYQGAAKPFGDMLRSLAIWQGSNPTKVLLGTQEVPGWQVATARGVWVLMEVEGTLVAFPDGVPMREFIQSMQITKLPTL